MNELAAYMTEQRKKLISFLSEHKDEQFTAMQAAQALKAQNVSVSAVYRNLAALEKEGKLRRCAKEGFHEAFYQYIAPDECCDAIHLSCLVCGKCFHVDDEEAKLLSEMIEKRKHFIINRAETVIYGVCEACSK